MKKNKTKNQNDLVTKKYLDEVLKERFAKNTAQIIKYVDLRFKIVDERFEKVDKKLEMLDSIVNTLDWLVKEYKDSKEERVVQFEQYKRLDQRVTSLEKRVLTA